VILNDRLLKIRSEFVVLRRDSLNAGSRGCTPLKPGSFFRDSNRFAEVGMPLDKRRSSRGSVLVLVRQALPEGLKETKGD